MFVPYDENNPAQVVLNVDYAELAQEIGLTPDKIKKDESVLGVIGSYEGNIGTLVESGKNKNFTLDLNNITYVNDLEGFPFIEFHSTLLPNRITYKEASTIGLSANLLNLANVLGITPDKIKAGETILGITGTYAG